MNDEKFLAQASVTIATHHGQLEGQNRTSTIINVRGYTPSRARSPNVEENMPRRINATMTSQVPPFATSMGMFMVYWKFKSNIILPWFRLIGCRIVAVDNQPVRMQSND